MPKVKITLTAQVDDELILSESVENDFTVGDRSSSYYSRVKEFISHFSKDFLEKKAKHEIWLKYEKIKETLIEQATRSQNT